MSRTIPTVCVCVCVGGPGIESLVARNGAGDDMFEEFFELSNGCICCSVKDDLVVTLERLMERRCATVATSQSH